MPSQALPKTQRACKACRSLKVRCLPSQECEICQKCLRSGAECIFEEQRPRRKRDKPDSRERVAALERKLEEVIAQVSQNSRVGQLDSTNGNDPSSVNARADVSQKSHIGEKDLHTTEVVNNLPTPESQIRDGHTSDTSGSARGLPCPANSAFTTYLSDGATPEILISHGQLSIEDVEHYLGIFREMCEYFPFVMIPPDASVFTLLGDRPLLLHSVLAVSASSEVRLQKVLEKSFKEIMLSRLMLEAERSIDLLQSILVCMAWGHFFHVPKRAQSYQMLQMAIALCVDMGLNLTPPVAMQKIGLHLEHFRPSGDTDGDRFWSREARRAFLGCYHVSTMHNWIWAKPNTLEYSEHILQCAKSISETPEYSTDELILPLVQIQHIGDEYHKVLQIGKDDGYSEGLLSRVGAHSRSFHRQIQDLRDSLTPTAATSSAVNLASHFAAVYSHEQDLLSPFISVRRHTVAIPPTIPTSNPNNCPSRIDLLLTCLQSATSCTDLFLALPLTSYPRLSTAQYSSLIYSLVMMYRLSIGTPRVPLWDVQLARDTVKLERYLETLCERMQQVTRERLRVIADTDKRDMYSIMGLVLQNVRNTYERLRHLPQVLSSVDGDEVHATSFPDEVVTEAEEISRAGPQLRPRQGPIFQHELPRSGYQNRCPAMQFWSVPEESGNGGADIMGDDPILDMGIIDDDGFWNQAFTMDQAQWNMDLGLDGI